MRLHVVTMSALRELKEMYVDSTDLYTAQKYPENVLLKNEAKIVCEGRTGSKENVE